MFKRIDHVEIIASDLKKTLDFYTRILGFKIKKRGPGSAGGPHREIVYLSLNDTTLQVFDLTAEAFVGAGYRRMAIEVDDMNAAIEYLKKKGVEITQPPTVRTGGGEEALVAAIKDPNGIPIELRQG